MTGPDQSEAQRYRAVLRANIDRYAWINTVHGLMLVLTGALAAGYAWLSSSTVTLTLACALIASTVFQLVALLLMKQLPYFSVQLISVACAIIIAVLLLRQGQASPSSVKNLVLIFLVVDNISRLIFALAIRPHPGWWLIALSSFAGLLLAALLATDFANSNPSIALIAAANFIATGLAITLLSWRSR